MPDRTRPIRREICLNEQELSVVRHKMNQLGTRNFGAYARKMLIDGYIIKVDYTEQKKLAAAVSRIATNINHVCRRINSTGHFYDADVSYLAYPQSIKTYSILYLYYIRYLLNCKLNNTDKIFIIMSQYDTIILTAKA